MTAASPHLGNCPNGWQRHPGAYVCDTVCAIDRSGKFMGTRPWAALLEWLTFHGIDPADMPAENLITRDLERRRIVYVRIVTDADGTRLRDGTRFVTSTATQQGETPPLPWPTDLYPSTGAAL